MTTQPASAPAPSCPNCDAPGPTKYCAECGQRAPADTDYALGPLLWAIFESVTSYDGRIFGTVSSLLLRPGELARDHFEGRRARRVSPFNLFLLASVLAWFLAPRLNIRGFERALIPSRSVFPDFWEWALRVRASLAGVSVELFAQRIDAVASAQNASAVLWMLPLFSLGTSVILSGRGLRFVQHLVFTAHFYCVHFVVLVAAWGLVVFPLARTLQLPPTSLPLNLWFLNLIVAPALIPYLYLGLRRAYGLTASEAGWRAVALGLWSCLVVRSFLDIAFALSLFAA